ncbi:MAG: Fic family protein [Nanoarchaeota archaeon]|nr:Fic family protein [Nanoarchaeota archaeon]
MVYIYRKRIGDKEYYYLRAGSRKGSKVIIKDIAYLGNDANKLKARIDKLPKKYSKEIRKAYRTINRFIEINNYLNEIKALKLKSNPYLPKEYLNNLEACRLHWNKVFKKHHKLTRKEILEAFTIEFAFNTTSIEGNTITLKEAEKLLLENRTPKNRTVREIYDLQNTEKVFLDLIENPNKVLNHELISKIHDDLLERIDDRKGYRKEDVRVFRSRFKSSPAQYVLTDMNLLLKWHNENKNKLHPFVLAVLFHHKFEKIHPFMDGNGRTGRMLMNHILMNNNYPPLIFRNRNRTEYIQFLSVADKANLEDSSVKHYKDLVEFSTKELTETYWNLFL